MEPSRGRDGTPDISRPFHGPKNVVCAPRSSPGKQPATGSKFTPAANPTHPPPPGTQRLKHLKRHLLTRKCSRLLIRTPKLIDHICPDTDSKKCECEVSRSSWYQTLPPVLNRSGALSANPRLLMGTHLIRQLSTYSTCRAVLVGLTLFQLSIFVRLSLPEWRNKFTEP